MAGWIALGLLILAGIALVFRHDAGTIAGISAADFAALATGIALLIVLTVPLLRRYDGRLLLAIRDAAIWGGLGLVLMVGYSFRAELSGVADRLFAELAPAGTPLATTDEAAGGRMVQLRRSSSGHFTARAKINGETVQMVVDTGATTIVLRPADADRIGIDISSLRFIVPVRTANGETYAAPVRLESVAVGPVRLGEVEALVARPGALDESLLGMSFLSRLRSYEFSGDYLTLRG